MSGTAAKWPYRMSARRFAGSAGANPLSPRLKNARNAGGLIIAMAETLYKIAKTASTAAIDGPVNKQVSSDLKSTVTP